MSQRLSPAFLADFDLRVVGASRLGPDVGPHWVVGINESLCWIASAPVLYDDAQDARWHARRVGARVLLFLREEAAAGRPRFVSMHVGRTAEQSQLGVYDSARDQEPASRLLSYLMVVEEWPDVAKLLREDRISMGLPPFDPPKA